MKNISAQTKALIELLNPPVGFWERLTGRHEDAGLLSQVGASGDAAAIIDITPFVLSERREVARAAAAAVESLLAGINPAELLQLDLIFRKRSPYNGRYGMKWHQLKPSDLKKLESVCNDSVTVLGMASFHKSGHIREAAIKRLDRTSSGKELPYLLIRLNDWVPNVREAAQQAINSRINARHAGSFMASLLLLARLKQAGRSDHRQLIETIETLLKSAESREALLGGLNSPDRLNRRMSFSLAINATGIDQSSVMARALSDQDSVIRLWAARKIAVEFEDTNLERFLLLMKGDRFMPVRREALRAFINRLPERAPGELRRALLDSHVSMREEARYHLQKTGGIDLASFYRQALVNPNEGLLSSAVSGMGETGPASDDSLLLPYIHHKSAKVRRAAIRGLSRLNGSQHLYTFITLLSDEAPGVSREAKRALTARINAVGGESLWAIFNSSPHRHVRRNALHLFAQLGKWDGIYYLIKAVGDADDAMAGASQHYIERWMAQFNHRFTAPTVGQLARLKRALEEYGGMLDENIREGLWFSMKGF
ncbi:MAG TPA: HEAT repeat domain-containing protein [Blastocatellia bacterium]|nr:HEAT repeat domain-containing protein [Blastocatellia bacterium]